MKHKGSNLAKQIDDEYRAKKKYNKDIEFRNEKCSICENKNTTLCEIRQTIDNNYKCIYFKEEIK